MMSLFPDRDPVPQEGSDIAYTPAEACEAIARAYFHGRPRGLTWEPCACGKPASFLCDSPRLNGIATCSAPICRECATVIGDDEHLCRDCAGVTRG